MSGRKQDSVWLYFDKTKVVGKTICRAMRKKNAGTNHQNIKKINLIQNNLI